MGLISWQEGTVAQDAVGRRQRPWGHRGKYSKMIVGYSRPLSKGLVW
jgi:hypothetical protein